MLAAYNSRTTGSILRQRACYSISSRLALQSSLISTSACSNSSASQRDQVSVKKGRSAWSKLLLFIPGAITFGLGTWQIFRRQEKIRMLEYRLSRLRDEPLKGNEILPSSMSLDSLEFKRVQCRGVFDQKKSIYVGPRSRSISGVTENGFYIIAPLMPVPGDHETLRKPILVNRGWVPRIWRDGTLNSTKDENLSSKSPTAFQESAKKSWWHFWASKEEVLEIEPHPSARPVEVIGVIRGGEKPNIFVPANDPDASQWFYVDVPAIAQACGLPEETLYVEDIKEKIDPSNPYPIPKDVNLLIHSSVMPQDHLNYTLTWYTLSAAVTFMATKRLKSWR